MPHLKSAKKRMRQTLKRRDHNRAVKKALKKQLKSVFEVAGDKASAADVLKKEVTAAVKKLDKAAAKGVVHPNLAARKKSQIARLVNARNKPAVAADKK
jgi:small subunit ribosomal protein S20